MRFQGVCPLTSKHLQQLVVVMEINTFLIVTSKVSDGIEAVGPRLLGSAAHFLRARRIRGCIFFPREKRELKNPIEDAAQRVAYACRRQSPYCRRLKQRPR